MTSNRIEEARKELKKFDYIRFLPDRHIYFDSKGRRFKNSVTGKIKVFKEPFDADFWAKKKSSPGVSPEAIKRQWRRKGKISCERGNILHKFIEEFYKGRDPERSGISRILIDQFLRFDEWRKAEGWLPVSFEQIVGSEEDEIVGTIDAIFLNKSGEVVPVDWKTVLNFETESRFHLTGKLNHLDSSHHTLYSLQLGIYEHILRKETGLKISDSHIVNFSKNQRRHLNLKRKEMGEHIIKIVLAGNE